ncbi:hypothetical protein [Nocardia sp. NPDC051570]|uniref:hypothetical protein n=1 Tax=Nocardia sp. NPDC051570 TaxID=3364324 RepID=UPI0037A0EB9E
MLDYRAPRRSDSPPVIRSRRDRPKRDRNGLIRVLAGIFIAYLLVFISSVVVIVALVCR